jgi:hypothetical protein
LRERALAARVSSSSMLHATSRRVGITIRSTSWRREKDAGRGFPCVFCLGRAKLVKLSKKVRARPISFS